MKFIKNCMIAIVSVLFLAAFNSAAFAATWSNLVPVPVGGSSISLSNNVKGIYQTPTTTSPQTYSAATYNSAGTKGYGVASGSPLIKYNKCANDPCGTTAGSALSLGTVGTSADISSWTTM